MFTFSGTGTECKKMGRIFMAVVPFGVSLVVTLLAMTALRPVVLKLGLVDRPGGRKFHRHDVPITGGLAMFIGMALGFLMIPELDSHFLYLLLAGGLLVAIGVLDDKFHVSARLRTLSQLSAVLIMAFAGKFLLHDIGDPLWLETIELGPAALIGTAIITLTVINAFNFVDGIDGLGGCLALIALVSIAIVAGAGSPVAALALVAASAVLGFLVFNFPLAANGRIRSFMGDAGSTFLGLVVVWLTISICQGDSRTISPVTGIWFAAIPLFDIVTCCVRRVASGRSPSAPGRDHFHHILERGGFSPLQNLGVLAGLQVVYATFGILGHFSGISDSLMFTIWSILGIAQYSMIKFLAALHRRANWKGMRNQLVEVSLPVTPSTDKADDKAA